MIGMGNNRKQKVCKGGSSACKLIATAPCGCMSCKWWKTYLCEVPLVLLILALFEYTMMITTYVLDYCMTDHLAEDFSHMNIS
jgi:hypothetical protein